MKNNLFLMLTLGLLLAGCSSSSDSSMDQAPPISLLYNMYFSDEAGIDKIENLQTYDYPANSTSPWANKKVVDKECYKLKVLVNDKLINESQSTQFHLFVDKDMEGKSYLVLPINFWGANEVIHTIDAHLQCPILFNDNEFHLITIKGTNELRKESDQLISFRFVEHEMMLDKSIDLEFYPLETEKHNESIVKVVI